MPQFIVSIVLIVLAVGLMLTACAYLIFLERKVAAWVQDRIGPNRTNLGFGFLPERIHMAGMGQALADGLKLLLKEDYTPPGVDRALFLLAPVLAIGPAMLGWAVIPWGGMWHLPEALGGALVSVTVAPINIGVVYILAIGSLAVYAVVLGGYASNNKYSFLGGLRATAQMLSYEIPMAVCVLVMILTYGTTYAGAIANIQGSVVGGGIWGVFLHPLLAIIFFTTVLAENNRAPFDLAEAEQELVGGYHTEYSSMKWALFFLGEYMHMITGCAFFALLFLGGWDLIPFAHALPVVGGIGLVIAKIAIYAAKVAILLFIMMWVRWTLPRFRFDQLMRLAWRGLIPMTLAVLLLDGIMVFLHAPIWALPLCDVAVLLGAAYIGPMLPQGPPVNRRIPLRGSRFNPA